MHLDPEQLQRLLHRELAPGDERLLRDHLEECSYCARRLDAALDEEREIFAVLRQLDRPAPPASVAEIAKRAAMGRPAWRGIAAGFALVVATTGALAALPGSPLPALLRRALGGGAASEPRAMELRPVRESGVAVSPGDALDVAFAGTQRPGTATVRLADGPDVAILARGQPVTFDVDLGRLTVLNAGVEASFEITIPRTAPSVRILVGGEVVLHKQRDRIVTSAARGPEGEYNLALGSPAPP